MEFKFTHTRLLVNHFKDCFVFYRDIMGFKPTYGSPEDIYGDFDTGLTNLALFDRQLMSEAIGTARLPLQSDGQDKACLVFLVDNVDAACEHLKALGVDLVAEPIDHKDWGVRTAHLRDPDGNLIEVNQGIPSQ